MIGNTKVYQTGRTPHQWRRQHGPVLLYPDGVGGARGTVVRSFLFVCGCALSSKFGKFASELPEGL